MIVITLYLLISAVCYVWRKLKFRQGAVETTIKEVVAVNAYMNATEPSYLKRAS